MKTETIGAILREYKQKARATIPDLLPQMSDYAKYILAMRREDADGWDTRGEPENLRERQKGVANA